MAKKNKYYVVWIGKKTGVFDSWKECEESVKGFEGAKYKSFETLEQAQKAFNDNPDKFISKNKKTIDELLKIENEPNYFKIIFDAFSKYNDASLGCIFTAFDLEERRKIKDEVID